MSTADQPLPSNLAVAEKADPCWTEDHLAHMEKYQPEYGLDLTAEAIAEERARIAQGKPTQRVPDGYLVFEVLVKGTLVGDVVIAIRSDAPPELDVAIFDDHAGNSYAKEAGRMVLQQLDSGLRDSLVATIRPQNRASQKVEGLLEALGFERVAKEGSEWRFGSEGRHGEVARPS